MAANRVARLTSPTDTWQPLRIRQSVEIRDLKLSSSVAEARMKFMQDEVSPDIKNLKTNNFFNTKDNEIKSRANLAVDEEKSVSDILVDKEEKPIELTSAMHDLPPLAPAPLALPEEALIPIPSPRMRRKNSSTSEQDLEKTKESESEVMSDDIFLTPMSSPLVNLRHGKLPESTTDGSSLEKSGVKIKPLAAVRQSKSLEAGADGMMPSRTGMVIFDMPVIPSPVNTKTISPRTVRSPVKSRTAEDVTSSRESSPQPPPKPKRLSAAVEASSVVVGDTVVPAPRKRTSKWIESNKLPENKGILGKIVISSPKLPEIKGIPGKIAVSSPKPPEIKGVPEAKTDFSPKLSEIKGFPEDIVDSPPKKVPPPRPELPAFLKTLPRVKSTLPSVTVEEEYPDDLNPFNDEGSDAAQSENASFKSCEDRKSLNPFDSDEDVEVSAAQISSPKVEKGNVGQLEAPAGSNPFDSEDDDESNADLDSSLKEDKPTPLPRKSLDSRSTDVSPASSVSRQTGQKYRGSYSADTSPAGSIGKASGSKFSFNSPKSTNSDTSGRRTSRDSGLDISPTGSISRGIRKKRIAPLPPGTPLVSSPVITHRPSPRSVKKSPAPPPPPPLFRKSLVSPISDTEVNEKTLKELDNLTLKSSGSDTAGNDGLSSPSPCQESKKPMNTFGYWKKKKPAPPVPIPPKRQITKLPMDEILKELKTIEEKQLEMERKGVELEKAIREENLQGHEDVVDGEESELVLQLFELVNQKNTLFRRQVELVYLRRQQRLEEEHAELEYQIRCLMGKPETIKTDEDRELEEELIVRLVEVVRQRSEVIESIETDRLREAVEDQSIQNQMTLRQG
uniref:BMERB domain-containing protein n=1 Tax=Strigamia maritima TaxID=126957 RepID=T1IIJ9_STRMM